MNRLAVTLGGRVAEELIFGDVTTGAQDDLERASQLARQMVCLFGMSEKLGPLSYGRREAMFLGDGFFGRPQGASEATAEAIDTEVSALVREAQATAYRLLSERKQGLIGLARTLESEETLEGEKLRAALEEAKIRDTQRAQPSRGKTMVA
jgi:cell division protease FtsH